MLNARKWDGKKISESGVISDLPLSNYHSDCCAGPSISSSGLRTIDKKTPLHYWAESYLNPDRLEREAKSHLNFGAAAHSLLLGETGFKERYAVRPDDWSDWRTSAAKEWRSKQILAGKEVLIPEDLEHIKGMAHRLAAEPLVQMGLLQGAVEHSLIWKDKTGVWLKSRPDLVTMDTTLVDLKTTTDASDEAIQRTIVEYGYAMQGALAGMAMRTLLGVEMTDFVLVWVEKAPPYAVNIRTVDPEWIYWSERHLRRAIDTFAKCVETNDWPGYQGEKTTYLPDWLKKRFEFEDQHKLIPEAAE